LAGWATVLLAHALPVATGVIAAFGVLGRTQRRRRIAASRTADVEPIWTDALTVDRYLIPRACDRFRGRCRPASRIGFLRKRPAGRDGRAAESQ
jgi:hypothetical protein